MFTWEEFLKQGDGIKDETLEEARVKVQPGHCACIIYTSGTTGNPKVWINAELESVTQSKKLIYDDAPPRSQNNKPQAVMCSHDSMCFTAHTILSREMDNFGLNGAQERGLSYLPLSHVAGTMLDIMFPLCISDRTTGYQLVTI